MGYIISLIFTLVFISSGCGGSKSTTTISGKTEEQENKYIPDLTLIDGHEQIITLNYHESFSATSCTLTDLSGAIETTSCSCSSGVCTVGLTPIENGEGTYTYTVSDGISSSDPKVVLTQTIEVVPFVSTWRVSSGDLTVTLPLRNGFNYDFTVDWGDGNTAEVTSYNDPDIDHTYALDGDYTVSISGLVEAWYFNDGGDKLKIISVSELGSVGWRNLEGAFKGCTNLISVSGGDTSNVRIMDEMFMDTLSVRPETSSWNTSNVISMVSMFNNARVATPDTSTWNTSNVTDMSGMFIGTWEANPDTSKWDTSNVTNMTFMFYNSNKAEPDTSGWQTSKVTNMSSMFQLSSVADPDMSGWDFSSVTTLNNMFSGTSLSTTNYDNLLIRLDATAGSGLNLNAGSSQYTNGGAGETARSNLLTKSWTISDNGGI